MLKVNWQQLKQSITTLSLPYQWVQDDNSYTISAFNNILEQQAIIPISNPASADQTDFETNYKSGGNKALVSSTNVQAAPPFGSKTIVVNGVTHNLYARFTGQQYSVSNGSNTLIYTATYNWAKIIGIEVVGALSGDCADLKVLDSVAGTYYGTPNAVLNQFAYTLNIAPNFYQRMAQFDADLYVGMQLQIIYHSVTTLPGTVGINFLLNEVK